MTDGSSPLEANAPRDYRWCPAPTTFEYYTERYYCQYLVPDCKGTPGNHVRVLQHSNGLCVVCVDPSHTALAALRQNQDLRIASVEFGSGRENSGLSPDRLHIVGKRKKNAFVAQVETKLCTLTLSDGTAFVIPACVNGFLLELNAALLTSPWLVAAAPTTEGYLAVVNPTVKNDFGAMEKLWTATGGDAPGEDED